VFTSDLTMTLFLEIITESCAKYSPNTVIAVGVHGDIVRLKHPVGILELSIHISDSTLSDDSRIYVNYDVQFSHLPTNEQIDIIIKKWENITKIDYRYSELVRCGFNISRAITDNFNDFYVIANLTTSIKDAVDIPSLNIINSSQHEINYKFAGNLFNIDLSFSRSNRIYINGFEFFTGVKLNGYSLDELNKILMSRLFPISVIRELKLREFI
jgi:hypothetical protein